MTIESAKGEQATTAAVTQTEVRQHPYSLRLRRIRAVVGTGLGAGGNIGFAIAFAVHEQYLFAAGMVLIGVAGMVASKTELESIYKPQTAKSN